MQRCQSSVIAAATLPSVDLLCCWVTRYSKSNRTGYPFSGLAHVIIRPYEDLLTSVKRRKLKWYGHVTRSSGLAKTNLQGTVQRGRQRGRQRKRWEDNIKDWTGLKWNILLRKAENREEWRKLQLCPNGQPDYGIDKIRQVKPASISTCAGCSEWPRPYTAAAKLASKQWSLASSGAPCFRTNEQIYGRRTHRCTQSCMAARTDFRKRPIHLHKRIARVIICERREEEGEEQEEKESISTERSPDTDEYYVLQGHRESMIM